MDRRDAGELPVGPDVAEERGTGDVVVADVVDLKAPGIGIAQQHVARVAIVEAAERDKGPIGPDLGQGIGGEDRVVADVVDLIEAACALAQDHVGRGAGRRRRVRSRNSKEAVGAVAPHEDAAVVDAGYQQRVVQRDVSARAVEEAVGRSRWSSARRSGRDR
jgi:hypothetical protein